MKFKLPWQDVFSWLGILVVTIAVVIGMHFLKPTGPVSVAVWIAWFLLVATTSFFTQKGQAFFVFLTEAKQELDKVVWPTRQETIQTTTIVVIMVTVSGFVLWGIDSGMLWVIGKITHLG